MSRKNKRDETAVQNFLASLTGLTMHEAYENARYDRRVYGWSDATTEAVILGIGRWFDEHDDAPTELAREERNLLDRS